MYVGQSVSKTHKWCRMHVEQKEEKERQRSEERGNEKRFKKGEKLESVEFLPIK